MFKFEELRAAHLEITSNCQASCPMCARNINGGIPNPHLTIASWSFQDYRRIFNEDVLKQMEFIRFSGNYGDPLLNDDLLDMIEYTSTVNPNINIRIHTNGGARKTEWWASLAKAMPKVHDVYFGIDGLEDTHHLHRIGTKYETVMRNAKTFIDAGGNAVWIFLLFKHNEHQEKEVEKRAQELGFTRFVARKSLRFYNTLRFEVLNKDGKLSHYLEPSSQDNMKYVDREFTENYKEYVKEANIVCPVLENKEIYIDAWQRVFPCCFLGIGAKFPVWNKLPDSNHGHVDFIDMYDEMTSQKVSFTNRVEKNDGNNLKVRSLKDVLNGFEWSSINWHKEYWSGDNKMQICARTCGENVPVSKPNDQYYKREILKSVNEEYDSDDKTRKF